MTIPSDVVAAVGVTQGGVEGLLDDLPHGTVVVNRQPGVEALAAVRVGDGWNVTGISYRLSTRKLLTFDGVWVEVSQ